MADQTIRKTDVEARQARGGGRVVAILTISMAVGLLAMFALLGYFYSTHSPLQF